MRKKALFICKQTNDNIPSSYGYFRTFSGLFNSAKFVSEMLHEEGFYSHIEIAHDNNDIDKLVTKHRPDVVFIEALWVVPEKFVVLHRLHPNVKWVVRLHSALPFLAMESLAVDWCVRYLINHDNVMVAPNMPSLVDDIGLMVSSLGIDLRKIVYLPNYYPIEKHTPNYERHHTKCDGEDFIVNIGCFGAIRPFKNQLIQAVAAIKFANTIGAKLRFHINGNRIEQQGNSNLNNIRSLFQYQQKHELVEHAWQPHKGFIKLLETMDMGMQVSFTETFNIVTADMVSLGIPVVTSSVIDWVNPDFYADPNSTQDIFETLLRTWESSKYHTQYTNREGLAEYDKIAKHLWTSFLDGTHHHHKAHHEQP
jgi:hypothetical protein